MSAGLHLRTEGQSAVLAAEEWRPVVGYEGSYEVSSLGRVRSLDRRVTDDMAAGPRRRTVKGRILTPYKGCANHSAYMRVGLMRDGKRKTGWVHVLVARAFLGPLPEGMATCHNDGQGHHNALSNLRYDTPSSNMQDQVRHGNHSQARKVECDHGHPFDDGNTYLRPDGNRDCRTCKRDRDREYRSRALALGRPVERPITHGVSGYSRYGCRCQVCRAANAEKGRRQRASRRAAAMEVAA